MTFYQPLRITASVAQIIADAIPLISDSWLCCRWSPLLHKKTTIVLISYLPLRFNRPKRGRGEGAKQLPDKDFATSNCCRLICCHETIRSRRKIDLLTLNAKLTLRGEGDVREVPVDVKENMFENTTICGKFTCYEYQTSMCCTPTTLLLPALNVNST